MPTTPPPRRRTASAVDPDRAVVRLGGPPHSLRARTSIANTGDQRLSIRGGELRLPDREPIPIPLGVILPAGTQTTTALSVDAGPHLPPGSYRGELEVGGIVRAADVRVEEHAALVVGPSRLLVRRGSTAVELHLTNDGNVALSLPRVTRGRLVAHDIAESAGAPDAELRLASALELGPGESADTTATVEVPDGLDPSRRHQARLPVGPADLQVTVLPADPAPQRRPRARKSTTGTARTTTGRHPTASAG